MILVIQTVFVVGLKAYRMIIYPYSFRFENQLLYSEQLEWIEENIKGRYKMWRQYDEFLDLINGYTFGFGNKKDAIAFKLRWT